MINKKGLGILVLIIIVITVILVYLIYFNNQITSSTSRDNVLLSKDEVISKAMPFITEYTSKNNRTIENITATYSDKFNGANQPCWTIQARFESVDLNYIPSTENSQHSANYQHWIIGYQVIVKADTCEILVNQEMGVY